MRTTAITITWTNLMECSTKLRHGWILLYIRCIYALQFAIKSFWLAKRKEYFTHSDSTPIVEGRETSKECPFLRVGIIIVFKETAAYVIISIYSSVQQLIFSFFIDQMNNTSYCHKHTNQWPACKCGSMFILDDPSIRSKQTFDAQITN